MSDSPDELLAQLRGQGELDSEGVFTENSDELLARLSGHLFADSDEFYLKFFQAFHKAGATDLTYNCDRHSVELVADSGRLEFPDEHWLRSAISDPRGVREYLAAGLVGAWATHTEIVMESAGKRATFRPAEGLAPELGDAADSSSRVRLKRAHSVMLPTHVLQPRMLASTLRVHWSGLLSSNQETLQGHSYSTQGEPLLLPGAVKRPDNLSNRIEGVLAMGKGSLALPGRLQAGPVFWQGAEPGLPCFEAFLATANSKGPRQAPWYRVRRFLLLRRPLSGPSYLIAVEAGVALRPLEVDLGKPGLAFFCSLEEEGLSADLSQSGVIQNAALERLLEEVRENLSDWLTTFRERVAEWQPGLGEDPNVLPAIAGSLLGMVVGGGLLAAAGLFFPPLLTVGAAVGAYGGDRLNARAKKKRIQDELDQVTGADS